MKKLMGTFEKSFGDDRIYFKNTGMQQEIVLSRDGRPVYRKVSDRNLQYGYESWMMPLNAAAFVRYSRGHQKQDHKVYEDLSIEVIDGMPCMTIQSAPKFLDITRVRKQVKSYLEELTEGDRVDDVN